MFFSTRLEQKSDISAILLCTISYDNYIHKSSSSYFTSKYLRIEYNSELSNYNEDSLNATLSS
jgi:hypothetical protein